MAMGTGKDVIKFSLYSGLSFYLYNEASFLALERLSKSSSILFELSSITIPFIHLCQHSLNFLLF